MTLVYFGFLNCIYPNLRRKQVHPRPEIRVYGRNQSTRVPNCHHRSRMHPFGPQPATPSSRRLPRPSNRCRHLDNSRLVCFMLPFSSVCGSYNFAFSSHSAFTTRLWSRSFACPSQLFETPRKHSTPRQHPMPCKKSSILTTTS
jgi:hypothetical protein